MVYPPEVQMQIAQFYHFEQWYPLVSHIFTKSIGISYSPHCQSKICVEKRKVSRQEVGEQLAENDPGHFIHSSPCL